MSLRPYRSHWVRYLKKLKGASLDESEQERLHYAQLVDEKRAEELKKQLDEIKLKRQEMEEKIAQYNQYILKLTEKVRQEQELSAFRGRRLEVE
jgi:hypothetical protein